jgi:hypothetical protein
MEVTVALRTVNGNAVNLALPNGRSTAVPLRPVSLEVLSGINDIH